jgi:hypothetical protein
MLKLNPYVLSVLVIAAIGVIALLNLPEGTPRFIAAGALVAGTVLVVYLREKAMNKDAKKRELEYLAQRKAALNIDPDSPSAEREMRTIEDRVNELKGVRRPVTSSASAAGSGGYGNHGSVNSFLPLAFVFTSVSITWIAVGIAAVLLWRWALTRHGDGDREMARADAIFMAGWVTVAVAIGVAIGRFGWPGC